MNRSVEKAFNLFAVNHPRKRYLATQGVTTGALSSAILLAPLDGGVTFGALAVIAFVNWGAVGIMGKESGPGQQLVTSPSYKHDGEYGRTHDGRSAVLNEAQKTKFDELAKKITDAEKEFKKSNSVGHKKSLNKKVQRWYRFQTDIIDHAIATRERAEAKATAHQKRLDAVKFDPKGGSKPKMNN